MAMKSEDYRLSMRISPRGRIDSPELRQLLVNRLSATTKAVLRRSLRFDNVSVYCERCNHWQVLKGDDLNEWTCAMCGARYRMEFAVYEQIDPEEITDGESHSGNP